MNFESLGLSAALLRAVSDQGYDKPTPIQAKAIPAVLEGRDVMAAAQTGTGKTAGFTLPMLHLLSERSQPKHRRVRALVLTPTRELAAQVMESVQTYGKHLPLKATAIFGGVNINPQIGALRRGVDIVVATPGRLLDHLDQGTLDLSGIQMLVLDEADRMLDMGFIRDIQRILKILPRERQNMMFSATFSNEIGRLAHSMLHKPVSIEVAPRNTATELVEQVVHTVDRNRKRELLSWLIGSKNWQQVLVFARTKHGCDRLAKQLEMDGLRAAAIHGNKTQNARTRALADFKRGKVRVLVATDIAARGLDIDHLPHVVNYELPNVPEDYVHRIGRTGRAGKEGNAASLVCVDELKLLKDIERVLNRSIPKEVIEGFEPDMSVKPEPIFKKPRGGNGQNKGRNNDQNSGQRNGGGGSSHKRQHSRNAKPGGNKRHGHQGQRRSNDNRSQGSSR